MARARVGINLGISPTHARNVALIILSLKTGLVSPQFRVKHDDMFEATRHKLGGFRLPRSKWQELSGFEKVAKPRLTEPRDDATEPARSQGRSGDVPAFEGAQPGGDDDLPDGDEGRPPDGGDKAMGVTTDNQLRRPQEDNGVERSTTENCECITMRLCRFDRSWKTRSTTFEKEGASFSVSGCSARVSIL
jgi:hypothetical protein